MQNNINEDVQQSLTNVISALGISKIKGSYLRYYTEVTNRAIKIQSLRKKLLESSQLTLKRDRIITKHLTIINPYLKRLAQSIHHNNQQPMQKAWNRYNRDNPFNQVAASVGYVPPIRDHSPVSRAMRQSTYAQAKAYYSQKIAFEISQAAKKGWYIVFDTLKFADDKIGSFYDDNNNKDATKRPINLYTGGFAKDIAQRLNIKNRDKIPRTDYYRFFCVPEYGSETNRLHFHLLHLMKVLPSNCERDPNFANKSQNRTEVQGMKYKWKYSTQTTPIAVRHQGDSFGAKLKWLAPKKINNQGLLEAADVKQPQAIAAYMSKYVAKGVDELESQGDKWNQDMKRKGYDARAVHRISISRGFGFNDIASMQELTHDAIIELTKLSHDSTPWYSLLKHAAKKELAGRIPQNITIETIKELAPTPFNYVSVMQSKLGVTPEHVSLPSRYKKISFSNLSTETINYLESNKYADHQQPKKPNKIFAGK